MSLICKLRGHKTVYRFVLQRFEVTVSGDAPTAAVVRLAQLSESASPVREVCTRCDVITWEGPRPSEALSLDQQGGLVSAPQLDPDSVPAKFSDGVFVGLLGRPGPVPRVEGFCSAWVVRRGRDEECGAVLLPEGGCANAHRHMGVLEEINARLDPPEEGDRC